MKGLYSTIINLTHPYYILAAVSYCIYSDRTVYFENINWAVDVMFNIFRYQLLV